MVATAQQERLGTPQSSANRDLESGQPTHGNNNNAASGSRSVPALPSRRHGPTTAHFYPGAWQTVLERAKNKFVRHVFLKKGFPVRDEDLHVADAILREEIARGESENLTLNNGEIHVILMIQYLNTL